MKRIAALTIALASSSASAQSESDPAEPAAEPEAAPEAAPEPEAATEPEAAEVASPPQVEPEPPRKTPFDWGKFGLSAGAGSTSAFGERYFAIGAATGYFVLDGVEIGLGTQFQWGSGPNIWRLSPGLRYVVQPLVGKFPLIPYVGTYYSHWFIGDGHIDQDAVGGRTGLLYVSGSIILGLGLGYERIVSECDPMMQDCSMFYPDLTIAISF